MLPCLTAPCLHAAHVTLLQKAEERAVEMLYERPGEAERGRGEEKADERREQSELGDRVMKTNVGWDGRRSYGRRSYTRARRRIRYYFQIIVLVFFPAGAADVSGCRAGQTK